MTRFLKCVLFFDGKMNLSCTSNVAYNSLMMDIYKFHRTAGRNFVFKEILVSDSAMERAFLLQRRIEKENFGSLDSREVDSGSFWRYQMVDGQRLMIILYSISNLNMQRTEKQRRLKLKDYIQIHSQSFPLSIYSPFCP